jgi:transposase
MQDALFGGTDAGSVVHQPTADRRGAVRMRHADRSQVGMHFCSIDELIPFDHRVRMIWDAVGEMDLSAFQEPIESREFVQGRPANDPAVMIGLLLWGAVNNVGRGRQLARLCETDLTYRWMCGGLGMNYHTLNDFRVGHEKALDALFKDVLGRLMHAELVSVDRISQDGLRVRASAGTGSFRKRPTLEKCLAEAEAHVAELKKQRDDTGPQPTHEQDKTLAEAIAADRLARVKAALVEVGKVEESKSKQHGDKAERPARASTTDPDARVMKMPNGGFNPAYNVQIASDPISRAIIGVSVSNSGADAPLSEPMRQQVEQATAQKVSEHLIDGGYAKLEVIDAAAEHSVTLYMPVPKPKPKATVQDRFARREDDSDAVADWRERMSGAEAKAIYKQRASTSETINADLRTFRAMAPFAVRGLAKVTCVALWSALAYNVMRFAAVLS